MKTILTNFFILFLANVLFAQHGGLIINGANVNIKDGATIYVDGNTKGNLTITDGGHLYLAGWLTLEGEVMNNGTMTLDTSASLIDNGLSTGTGIANYKKCIDGQYSLFSIPVSGLTANDITEFALEKYDETASAMVELGPSDNLLKMTGYSPTASFGDTKLTIELTGTLNTGNNTLPLQLTADGLNLAGNPYPSGINWNEIVQMNSNIDKALYAWNGYNYSYFLANSGLAVNGGTPFIRPGNAFFVKANVDGSLGFSNSIRVHSSEDTDTSSANLGNYLLISVENGIYKDETLINFIPGASTDYDPDFDAIKLLSPDSDVPQVYTGYQSYKYAINCMPLNETETEVPLHFKANTDGVYQFQFIDYKLDNTEYISIKDRKFSEQQVVIFQNNSWLAGSPSFPFNYYTSDMTNRFTLVFKNTSTDFHQNKINDFWKVYSSGKTVYVDANISDKEYLTINIYNTLGQLVYRDKAFTGINSFHLNWCYPGIYYVSTIMKNKVLSNKILIR